MPPPNPCWPAPPPAAASGGSSSPPWPRCAIRRGSPSRSASASARSHLWDVDPVNLFRITWKNDPKTGLFNDGNWLEFPPELTGVDARIVGLVGKWFPTGAHKVGAGFGCLVPRLVTGQFDPTTQVAVWPSTGNFCRGGAFDCALLGCRSLAILPEEMSRERFEWLRSIGAEIIATPGCESNVKEIYDKCWNIRKTRPECVIFNQFEEFGNPIWHYHVTGAIVDELFAAARRPARPPGRLRLRHRLRRHHRRRPTILRTRHPSLKVAAVEALQCPTLLQNGFGAHRIEGIGDKHVPWIHNVRNTDFVAAIDDAQCLAIMRLFNEPEGQTELERAGVPLDARGAAAAARHLRHLQPGRGDQDGAVLRNGPAGRASSCR